MQTLLFKGQLFNFNSLVLILLCSGFGSFLLFIFSALTLSLQ